MESRVLRVAILGNSGSGKSSLARALSALAHVPTLDLDTIAWEHGEPPTPRAEHQALEDVREFCRQHPSWIVEGCYANLLPPALAHQPTLLFLNPGRAACLANCRSRPFEPHKYASPEEQHARLDALLAWVAAYDTRTGPLSLAAHRACFATYPGPKRELLSLPSLDPLDPDLVAGSV